MTHLDLAQLCQHLYLPNDCHWDNYWDLDTVVVGHKKVGDEDVIVFRGSATIADWVRDAEAEAFFHPKLQWVHKGMSQDIEQVYAAISALPLQSLTLTGHSLGASRAFYSAALFASDKRQVNEVVTFGSPKPAFKYLAELIALAGIKSTSYRHANDIVPTLPFTIPPLFNYVHTQQLTQLPQCQSLGSDSHPLQDHFIANYVLALQQLAQ